MSQIDTAGTYIGTIEESGVGLTNTNQYPQFIARLKAEKKWVDDKAGMEHFGLTEPAWVDWSEYSEDIIAYMVLFNSANEFSNNTKLLNYEQLQAALGWNGTDFESLNDQAGKRVLFRVEPSTWVNPKTNVCDGRMQVSWIDAEDVEPVRKLKKLADDDVKALSAALSAGIGKKPAAKAAKAAKPVSKPATKKADPTPAPSAGATSTTADASTPAAPQTPNRAKSAPPSKKAPPPAAKPVEASTGLPKDTDQMTAWGVVCDNKGDNSDDAIQEAWIAACSEVGENKDESEFTGTDWAKVRDIVIRDLSLTVA